MKYEDWEPLYREICEFFSFDPADDERAARIAASLVDQDATDDLITRLSGNPVTVCGNAPILKDQLDRISGIVLAADGAAGVLASCGIVPEVIVSDLDGIDDYALDMNQQGTILVVHAHGDNIPRLTSWLPRLSGPVVLTTQGRPFDTVRNFGGFSDGDRAIFMAQECGASRISIIGFDCDDPAVSPIKKGKLLWARRLLAEIGYDC